MTDYTRGPGEARGPADIEADIRRTRDRMGDDIEAIGDKLSPDRIKQRAKQAVSRKTRETGQNIWRTAKENPVPTAIVALGLTLLFRARRKDREENGNGYSSYSPDQWSMQGDYDSEGMKEKAQHAVSAAGDKVQDVAHQAAQKAKRTGNKLQEFFESNPASAGAGVIVLGAAVGALIPETQKEKQLMGSARDELVGQAKGIAQHAQGAIEQKMSEQPSTSQSSTTQSQQGGQRYGSNQRQ